MAALSCGGNDSTGKHEVYFVGYVYDGASGKRLAATDLTAISLKYRDNIIKTTIESDGRFVTTDPLPTWQDYAVYVGAPGYRPFVSNNAGIDVPKSVQMTDGVNSHGTVQTFDVTIRLFPVALAAPKVSITIEKGDALVTVPAPARASGTIRLTPVSSSLIQQGSSTADRVWANDEDLLTQTLTKPFTGGLAEFAPGELVYGVSYQIAIFDVEGYQPFTGSSSGSPSSTSVINAGAVTSLFLTLQPVAKAPLRILGTDADKCTPPATSSNAYGAMINVTFSEEIEPAGPTFAEDIDNGLAITSAAATTGSNCTLNINADPTKQERGTKAAIDGRVLTLSFNPVAGLATISQFGTTCMTPTALTSVVYALANVFVQPKSDPVRKANVGTLLTQFASGSTLGTTASSLSCPTRPASTSSF